MCHVEFPACAEARNRQRRSGVFRLSGETAVLSRLRNIGHRGRSFGNETRQPRPCVPPDPASIPPRSVLEVLSGQPHRSQLSARQFGPPPQCRLRLTSVPKLHGTVGCNATRYRVARRQRFPPSAPSRRVECSDPTLRLMLIGKILPINSGVSHRQHPR